MLPAELLEHICYFADVDNIVFPLKPSFWKAYFEFHAIKIINHQNNFKLWQCEFNSNNIIKLLNEKVIRAEIKQINQLREFCNSFSSKEVAAQCKKGAK